MLIHRKSEIITPFGKAEYLGILGLCAITMILEYICWILGSIRYYGKDKQVCFNIDNCRYFNIIHIFYNVFSKVESA